MSEEDERTVRGNTNTFKATAVCFTYNNPTIDAEELLGIFEANGAKYTVFQREEGDETGTPHFQGYAHFGRQRRFGPAFRACFPEAIWLTAARGNPATNRAYCTKEATRCEGPWESGELPAGQGSRSDLTSFYEAVTSGKRARHLLAEYHTVFARYPRYYNTIVSLQMPALRAEAVQVVLSFGKTGIGKTHNIVVPNAGSDEFWRKPLSGGFWMDGYDGHEVALFDDFAGASSKITLVALLQILDRYPVQVPVKCSHVWWHPKLIYLTTNIHPWEWYDYSRREEQYRALMRRFTTIMIDLVEVDDQKRKEFEDWRTPPPEISQYPGVHPNHGVWRGANAPR